MNGVDMCNSWLRMTRSEGRKRGDDGGGGAGKVAGKEKKGSHN